MLFCLFFLTRMHCGRCIAHGGVHGSPSHPHNSPYDLWHSCVILVKQFPPPYPCQNHALRAYLCLCLPCFAFAGCQCILLHPFEPISTLLSTSLPLYVCTHICVFWGKFPVHTWPGIIPCHPISVFFCLVCLYISISVPNLTHTNPRTSISNHNYIHIHYMKSMYESMILNPK